MRLTERVHVVGGGELGFGISHPLDCHVYLINGGSELALVDAGVGLEPDRIVSNIQAEGLDPGRLKYLLLTHAHADHAGGCRKWKDRFHISLLASPEAGKFVRTGDEAGISLTSAKTGGFYPSDYHFEACPVDRKLHEGDVVRVGDCELNVFETPGHCCGMLSYRMTFDSLTHLFAGDTVFHGGKVLVTNVYDCDLQQYVGSLRKLAQLSVDVLLPGHLCIALAGGEIHIRKAIDYLDHMVLPPNIF